MCYFGVCVIVPPSTTTYLPLTSESQVTELDLTMRRIKPGSIQFKNTVIPKGNSGQKPRTFV